MMHETWRACAYLEWRGAADASMGTEVDLRGVRTWTW